MPSTPFSYHLYWEALRAALSRLVALTLLAAFATFGAQTATAHEVQPSIGDLVLSSNQLELDITLTLEPLIARADLDGLEDTDASARAGDVDRLRALNPSALQQEFDRFWPEMASRITIKTDDSTYIPRLVSVEIPPVGDTALPRLSVLRLSTDLSPGNAPVVIGWDAEFGALVIRQNGMGDDGYSGYLTGGALSAPIQRSGVTEQSGVASFLSYIAIGYEHIIPKGLDHILFVLGLFFLSMRARPLLWQITAFTLAHTVTLALGILGYVSVPASVVEPLIAVSIVYVGIENVLSRGLSPWRPVVVFLFGLLHGLGFASVLGEIGLNPARYVSGLIGFNVGVELGQLTVIAIAFLTIGVWFGHKPWYRRRISNPASIGIALIGAWWAFERTFA